MIEKITTSIMEKLEKMSNDTLTWINSVTDNIMLIVEQKGKKRWLRKLKQAQIFLEYVRDRLQTRFIKYNTTDGTEQLDRQGPVMMKQNKNDIISKVTIVIYSRTSMARTFGTMKICSRQG